MRQHILFYFALLKIVFWWTCGLQIQTMQLTRQVDNIFATLDQSNLKCTKRGTICSLFNFLFGTSNSAKEINAIKNNMAVLKEIKISWVVKQRKKVNFINLMYVEIDTQRLLLRSLQKDFLQINSTARCLSKELKTLFHNRNFFIIMFQLRSHLATLCNGMNLVKIDILSILNQVYVIGS